MNVRIPSRCSYLTRHNVRGFRAGWRQPPGSHVANVVGTFQVPLPAKCGRHTECACHFADKVRAIGRQPPGSSQEGLRPRTRGLTPPRSDVTSQITRGKSIWRGAASAIWTIAAWAIIAAFSPTAFAAESVWSVEFLNARKAEWEQLVGPTVRVEGRVALHGKGNLRLAKCELNFRVTESQLRLLNNKKTIEISGRFKREEGKVWFEVAQIQAIPSDLEQFESRSSKLRNPRPAEWYELGDWAVERSRFYDDAELAKRGASAYAQGLKAEWRLLPADDGEARLKLAIQAKEYKFPDDQRLELLHEGHRQLWQAALKVEQPAAESWRQLASRLAKDLPGCTQALPEYPVELKRRYDREPLTVYREASPETRLQLHRMFYAAIVLRPIVSEAAADGRDGHTIADRIEQTIPEEQALAAKFREGRLAWRLTRVASVTRQEAEQLASDYRVRQQPILATQALQTWLKARESRMREDGSHSLLQHAEEYLELLKDEDKAASLLIEANKLDPQFEDVTHRLSSLGYKRDRGTWTKSGASPSRPSQPAPDDTPPQGISIGMTSSALKDRMGARPDSISRAITKSGAIEIWNYGDSGGARLTFHLERTGRGELKVIEFVNGR